RKQELQSGGRRSTVRSWKTFYAVFVGQSLFFYRDHNDYLESKPSGSPPIHLVRANCVQANDYVKKRHVIRLCLSDASEYLFALESESVLKIWLEKMIASNDAGEFLPPPPAEPPAEEEPIYANAGPSHQEESSFEDEADTHSVKEKKSRFGRFFGRASKAV
ncbi:Spectrin beta chain_ brain 4like, partial [Caligus rogercresseyi]